jgi:transcriptional regulator with XRE-family HTH domain
MYFDTLCVIISKNNKEVIMGKFQNVFKSLRIREGLTQGEIAEKLGVTRSAVGNWEQGSREPDFETAEAIADFFNVDMNVLAGCADKTYCDDLQIKQIAAYIYETKELGLLFEAVKGLSTDKINAIIDFVNRMK